MRWFALLILLGHVVWALPPLQVTSVGRTGLPPYEEDSERVYRLEGPGCPSLRVGELLVLQRKGEHRNLGRLEIISAHLDHAQARLAVRGETFPLKGDLAIRTELLQSLPTVLMAAQDPLPAPESLRPRVIVVPRVLEQKAIQREPIYFLLGDASLSPGGAAKLQTWVETWGTDGQWSLECPQVPGDLTNLRTAALWAELKRLGVPSLEIRSLPAEPPGQYDAIYIKKEPR